MGVILLPPAERSQAGGLSNPGLTRPQASHNSAKPAVLGYSSRLLVTELLVSGGTLGGHIFLRPDERSEAGGLSNREQLAQSLRYSVIPTHF